MKRKNDESAFEFRKRKKKERFRKEHRYDSEKNYWKNASKNATRQQKSGIEKLFAGAGASSSGAAAYNASKGILNTLYEGRSMLPVVEEALGGEIMADLLVPVALSGSIAGGAVALGGAAGYLIGEGINSMFTQNNLVDQIMPGTYQGKFQLSANKSFKGLRDKYQKKGAVYITENYGSVADPDIVYIAHSSFNLGSVAASIGLALLRKLFRVGLKIDVDTPLAELPLINTTPDSGPDGFLISYTTKTSDGTVAKVAHNIPNDHSLYMMYTRTEAGFRLSDNLLQSMVDANPAVLQKVHLYMVTVDDQAGPSYKLQCEIDLTHEILSVAMSSHMVLQNRTKSATGQESTTQVDVQPVKGPVYEFSSGVPKLKSTTPVQLSYTNTEGLLLVRGGQLPGTDVTMYREPLVKSSFQSVVKSAYVRLNPGALKSMTIGSDLKGYYSQVIFKLRCNLSAGYLSECYGRSQMVMFEEELNSGSANNITITYECQHIAGADFTTTYNPNMQPGFTSAQISNLPS